MPSRVAHVLRVFTRDGQGGNHLGVINDITDLDTETMQEIAAELGFAETVFVDWSSGGDPYVRIFTPGQELPFAGHPLVGTAWTLLQMGPGGIDTVRCGIGEVAIGADGDTAWIRAPLDALNAARIDLYEYASRAGLTAPAASWLVKLPKDYAILVYDDVADVASADPDHEVMKEWFGTMLVAPGADVTRVRFFAPDAGVFEDAATGSAAVAYATALVAAGEATGSIVIHQGEEMGSPSRIDLTWTQDAARIGGGCVHEETRVIDT